MIDIVNEPGEAHLHVMLWNQSAVFNPGGHAPAGNQNVVGNNSSGAPLGNQNAFKKGNPSPSTSHPHACNHSNYYRKKAAKATSHHQHALTSWLNPPADDSNSENHTCLT